MHILTEKRITKLCSKLLNDSDEINHTQHKNRGDNYESIHKKISVCVLGQFLAKKNFKDLKDFSKPYIFITTLALRHNFLTS